MKLQGSKIVYIECTECPELSPDFRVYLYDDEYGKQWNGKFPEGWTTDDEAELEEENIIFGRCPKHPIEEG